MIEIKHKETGEVLWTTNADTLDGANMQNIDLTGADFSDRGLANANLAGAKLAGADFSRARFDVTSCEGASLRNAIFYRAYVDRVNFSRADLTGAVFVQAYLCHIDWDGANLDDAVLAETSYAANRSLHLACCLDTIRHMGIAYLDQVTIRHSIGGLPDSFLEASGYTQIEIETLRALYGKGIQFYSVFISRAEPDVEFAERLVADLRHENVSCWHYTQDMKGGEDWQDQVNRAIKVHEKLLLVCTANSVYRPNVVKEIYQAIDEERRTGVQKLFPIRLDDHILSPEMEQAGLDAARIMNRLDNWVAIVKKKHIPDFSNWEDNKAYKAKFADLLRDLKR